MNEIGLISDTHGLLRPEAVSALQGVVHILHAGDVGDPAILERLAEIAPVTAIRGNVDTAPWARELPETEVAAVEGVQVYLLHNLDDIDLDPKAAGFQAVLYGHSHRPAVSQRGGVLYVNPGSAGPRRFNLPITVGRMRVRDGEVEADIIPLDIG